MIQESAVLLDSAERNRVPIAPLSETYPSLTPGQAYAIQSAWFALKLAQGARLVGRKIGLTSQAMQQQMGVDQSDYGFLLDTMAVPTGGVLACGEFLQARIEPEIAFWLAEDLRGHMVSLAKNNTLLEAYRRVSVDGIIWRVMWRMLDKFTYASETVTTDHLRLVEAYESGDTQYAKSVIVGHTERAKQVYQRAIELSGGQV